MIINEVADRLTSQQSDYVEANATPMPCSCSHTSTHINCACFPCFYCTQTTKLESIKCAIFFHYNFILIVTKI